MKSLLSRSAVLMLLVAAAPSMAAAQATVIRPDRALSPDEIELRSAMYQLRDTLAMVSGWASRMQRDFRQTSPAALVSRAREIALSCQAALRNVPVAEREVRTHAMKTRLETAQQQQFLKVYVKLRAELADCSKTFSAMAQPGKGEELRGYGNAWLESLREALQHYSREADDFFSALRIPNRPLGAGPNPLNKG
ncbi:MAG TPA: hypothetical protein VFO96_01200 [Gemmatimonadales bacterium]|jgi:hypothetical protein|nr:hypothetical protein [Gemmatimonadales bacterium]